MSKLVTVLALFLALALATSAPVHAQPKIKVGVLSYTNQAESAELARSLRAELKLRSERPPLAYDVSVLPTPYTEEGATAAVMALKRLKPDIVLLMSPLFVDKVLEAIERVPVITTGQGYVSKMPFFQSVARPGGRVTGFIREPGSLAKRVELLRSFCPAVRRVGALVSSESASDPVFIEFLAYENALLRSQDAVVIPLYMTGLDLIGSLPVLVEQHRLDALSISVSIDVRDRLPEVRSALEAIGIPHVYSAVAVVEQGAALGMQPARFDVAKIAAEYISRIAHGEPAGEIPVQISRAYDIAVHTERIKDFRNCDPRRIAKIATRFFP